MFFLQTDRTLFFFFFLTKSCSSSWMRGISKKEIKCLEGGQVENQESRGATSQYDTFKRQAHHQRHTGETKSRQLMGENGGKMKKQAKSTGGNPETLKVFLRKRKEFKKQSTDTHAHKFKDQGTGGRKKYQSDPQWKQKKIKKIQGDEESIPEENSAWQDRICQEVSVSPNFFFVF